MNETTEEKVEHLKEMLKEWADDCEFCDSQGIEKNDYADIIRYVLRLMETIGL